MPIAMKRPPTDAEFEAIMADPPIGGFSAWRAAEVAGWPYKRVLAGMQMKQIEVLDLGGTPRLSPKTVRKLREQSRGTPLPQSQQDQTAAA